jgi:hypothetical protein
MTVLGILISPFRKVKLISRLEKASTTWSEVEAKKAVNKSKNHRKKKQRFWQSLVGYLPEPRRKRSGKG